MGNIRIQNKGNCDDSSSLLETARSEYSVMKASIEMVISELVELIKEVPSTWLLYALSNMEFIPTSNDSNTLFFTAAESGIRPTEYIQSLLSVVGCNENEDVDTQLVEIVADEILSVLNKLNTMVRQFELFWEITLSEELHDPELVGFISEAQSYASVRGKRYRSFQVDYVDSLLRAHDFALSNAFGIGCSEVIEGFEALLEALTNGRFEPIMELGRLVDHKPQGLSYHEYYEQNKEESDKIALHLTPEAHSVERITGWPTRLIEALSSVPEKESWPPSGGLELWPNTQLPIRTKPFIRLRNTSYCFDYYSLADNFYRALRRALIDVGGETSEEWNKLQAVSSESAVKGLLEKLLPGCEIYANNYYRDPNSPGNYAENDLLVLYDDVLLVVEVKAAAFPPFPPICDYACYVDEYRKILEKADDQCQRVLRYYHSCEGDAVSFLDNSYKPKLTVHKRRIRDRYCISVTVDNVNEFAAKLEKVGCLNAHRGTISIAIDDLDVYSRYFDSPLVFLHFLSQRKAAARSKTLALNDELDHLGFYIERNQYASAADELLAGLEDYDWVFFDNLRTDLDSYFNLYDMPSIRPEKPVQLLPELYTDILDCLVCTDAPGRVSIATYLLDFSEESRAEFCESVAAALKRAVDRKRRTHVSLLGNTPDSIRCSVCISVDGAFEADERGDRDYALCQIVGQNEPNRVLLSLTFGQDGRMMRVKADWLSADQITPEEQNRLLALWSEMAERRVEHALSERKIRRNEPCPCGSGKKYKKCHGR